MIGGSITLPFIEHTVESACRYLANIQRDGKRSQTLLHVFDT